MTDSSWLDQNCAMRHGLKRRKKAKRMVKNSLSQALGRNFEKSLSPGMQKKNVKIKAKSRMQKQTSSPLRSIKGKRKKEKKTTKGKRKKRKKKQQVKTGKASCEPLKYNKGKKKIQDYKALKNQIEKNKEILIKSLGLNNKLISQWSLTLWKSQVSLKDQ